MKEVIIKLPSVELAEVLLRYVDTVTKLEGLSSIKASLVFAEAITSGVKESIENNKNK